MRLAACVLLPLAVAASGAARSASAQALRVGAHGAFATYQDAGSSQWGGYGAGASATVLRGRWRLEASAWRSSMDARYTYPTDPGTLEVTSVDARLALNVISVFWLEVGGGRITTAPDLLAQDAGLVRVGLLSSVSLGSSASIEARASYVPVVRYSGGGSSTSSLEAGFATTLHVAGSLALEAGYELRRLDHQTATGAVPLQVTVGRIGISLSR